MSLHNQYYTDQESRPGAFPYKAGHSTNEVHVEQRIDIVCEACSETFPDNNLK